MQNRRQGHGTRNFVFWIFFSWWSLRRGSHVLPTNFFGKSFMELICDQWIWNLYIDAQTKTVIYIRPKLLQLAISSWLCCIYKMLRKMILNKIYNHLQRDDKGCIINYYNRAVVPSGRATVKSANKWIKLSSLPFFRCIVSLYVK